MSTKLGSMLFMRIMIVGEVVKTRYDGGGGHSRAFLSREFVTRRWPASSVVKLPFNTADSEIFTCYTVDNCDICRGK